jgi:flavin reductase (DIM6/NTAB) family NADH-FMN oxidoreductase RutF
MSELVKCHELPEFDPFKRIGGDFALLGAVSDGKYNAMTVSWGECGVLWNKSVFTVFVRPQRYTHTLSENTEYLSLSFFDEEYRKTLIYFGRNSGRDEDKFEKSGLTAEIKDNALIIPEANLVLVGRIIYKTKIRPEEFVDREFLSNYAENDFHTVYTCEITDCYKKDL